MNKEIEFSNTQIEWSDEAFEEKAIELSRTRDCYVVYGVMLRKVIFSLSSRKPTSGHDAENTYRYHGGFFKSGKVVSPSKTFVAKYNKIRVR